MELWEEYEPKSFDELLGQHEVIKNLKRLQSQDWGGAMFFQGPSGVGKTTAARLVAKSQGINVHDPLDGYEVVEGGTAGLESMKLMFRTLHCGSFRGKRRVLVVNQSNHMHGKELLAWIGWLERLPAHATVIFTCTKPTRVAGSRCGVDELESRGTVLQFEGRRRVLQSFAETLIYRVWQDKGCPGNPPLLDELLPSSEQLSFRQVLMQLRSRLPAPGEPEILREQRQCMPRYTQEMKAYLASESAQRLAGRTLTHAETLAYVKRELTKIRESHSELKEFDPSGYQDSGESWRTTVNRGKRATQSCTSL